MRIYNGTVVQEKYLGGHKRQPLKGVVISQTSREDRVIVRYEGGAMGEWEESVHDLIVLDEQPVQDGTRAYTK